MKEHLPIELTCQNKRGTPALAHNSLTIKNKLKLQYLIKFVAAINAPPPPPEAAAAAAPSANGK